MRYSFPYDWVSPIEIPEENLIGVYEAGTEPPDRDEKQIIEEALTNPIGTPRIREMVRKGQKVLILSDDITRVTPVWKIMPLLLEELETGGIRPGDIRILIATGTHRAMSREECIRKLGQEVVDSFEVSSHQWDDEETLRYLGKAGLPRKRPARPGPRRAGEVFRGLGVEVWVNKAAVEADFIVAVGGIIPHTVSGFSGGGKMIVPGIVGEKTGCDMHWAMVPFKAEEIFAKRDNPVRELIDAVSRKVGLDIIINAVMNNAGQIVGMVVGDLVEAHKAGTEICRRVHGVRIPSQADIVIVDSCRMDIEYWQAVKALDVACLVTKPGGVIIHVADCPEGVAVQHPEVLQYGYKPLKEIFKMLENGLISKGIAVHMIEVSRAIIEKATGILISRGITNEETEHLGLRYASDSQEALEMAFEMKGPDAKIAVLRQAGDMIPIIDRGGAKN